MPTVRFLAIRATRLVKRRRFFVHRFVTRKFSTKSLLSSRHGGIWSRTKNLRTFGIFATSTRRFTTPSPPSPPTPTQQNPAPQPSYTPNDPQTQQQLTEQNNLIGVGVLDLDDDYTPQLGDIDYKQTFEYPMYKIKIKSWKFEDARTGKPLSDDETTAITKAIKDLESKNVALITGDCGFMLHYQHQITTISQGIERENNKPPVPIDMSSLSFLPLLLDSLPDNNKVLILTADSDNLKVDTLQNLIFKRFNEKVAKNYRHRVVIQGMQKIPGFGKEILNDEPIKINEAAPHIVQAAKDCIKNDPSIGLILFECTELPVFGNLVKNATNLAVFDILTLTNLYHGAKGLDVRLPEQL